MATINDIAEKLHISNATVSRALRSSGYVKAELKEKIFKTAEELGYAPNPLAVGLRTRRSHGISIVLPSMNNPVSVELLENLEKLADRNGYHVMISTTDGNIETERKYVQLLDAGLVDGTVLVPCPRRSPEEEYLQHIRKRNIALFNRDLAGLSLDVVKSDAVQAGRLAMEHLACRGYRRIGMILPPLETSLAQERLEGCQEGADAAGIRLEERWMRRAWGTTPEAGKAAADELLSRQPRPDGLLVLDNILTVGVLQALREKNLSLPEDLGLVSFDDIVNGELVGAGITYVGQPMPQIAEALFSLLLLRMEGQPGMARQSICLPVRLIERGSTRRL